MGVLAPLRHQLASTSPIDASVVARGVRASVRRNRAERESLRALLRDELDVADVVLTASGTQALALAFRWAHRALGADSALALPSFACFDIAAAAIHSRRPVVFYDVDPDTLGPDLASLSSALDAGGRIVVLASLFGVPLDWTAIDPMLESSGAWVVEDAAQGQGATWQGRRLGSHGRLGVLSFSRGKGWTGGAGGALLVRSEDDADGMEPPRDESRRMELGVVARAAAHWLLGRPTVYGLPRRLPGLALGETRYHELSEIRDMPEAAAAVALATRDSAERAVLVRRNAARHYDELLRESGAAVPVRIASAGTPGYVRYPVVLQRGIHSFRDPGLAVTLGAAPSYPVPLPFLPQLHHVAGEAPTMKWPGATLLAHRLVTLPTHPLVHDAERERLVDLLRS